MVEMHDKRSEWTPSPCINPIYQPNEDFLLPIPNSPLLYLCNTWWQGLLSPSLSTLACLVKVWHSRRAPHPVALWSSPLSNFLSYTHPCCSSWWTQNWSVSFWSSITFLGLFFHLYVLLMSGSIQSFAIPLIFPFTSFEIANSPTISLNITSLAMFQGCSNNPLHPICFNFL